MKTVSFVILILFYTYYHPAHTKTDILMIVLFWIGLTFFVMSEKEDE